jgi:hypothetical protein
MSEQQIVFTPTHVGSKIISATQMNRFDYNVYRGWLTSDEEVKEDGYLVEYEPHPASTPNMTERAGYVSWSPLAVFDDAYNSVSAMTFSDALTLLKKGKRISRAGWNGKGLTISLQQAQTDANSGMTLPFLYMQYPLEPASDTAPANHIGARVPWLASQTDILAEDWCIVN